MTPKEAIAELQKDLAKLKDSLCVHQDEFGMHYTDPDAVWRMEEMVEALETAVSYHVDWFADWLASKDGAEPYTVFDLYEMWNQENS